MRAIVGHSDDVDTGDAIADVLAQCLAELGDDVPRGALFHTTNEYDAALALERIQECFPGLPVVGSTTDGEVSSRLGFRADSMCMTLFVGDELDLRTGHGLAPGEDLDAAIETAVAGLGEQRPALCVLLCSSQTVNVSEVLDRLHTRLGDRACPIVGGLAGDHAVGPETVQFHGTSVCHDSLTMMFFCGDVEISWGVSSGWFPVGPKHRVTRSEGAVVHEIDGQSALDIYESFWGDRVSGSLGEFPLAVMEEGVSDSFYLRAAMDVDREQGSIRFAGTVPEGSLVQMTDVVPEGLLVGTQRSLEDAIERFRGKDPAIALMFSCAARKWVLGSRAELEIEQLLEQARHTVSNVAFSGFYAFGEICPLSLDGPPVLHNETCVTVLLGN